MKWSETTIQTSDGPRQAVAPEIISASRATDIPAFYAEWFINRLREGYVKRFNPYTQRPQYISLERARAVVFWSKNPRPLMKFLPELDARGLAYYFQFTLNDYEAEKLEPGVPALAERIKTFTDLAQAIGKERVIWRYDPLVLLPELDVDGLLARVKSVGDRIARSTSKLVFSFADIGSYRKVPASFKRRGIEYREFDQDAMAQTARGIAALCQGWGIAAATCAERIDLSVLGIEHNKCIDDELILRITRNDPAIRRLFGLDAPGQDELFALTRGTGKDNSIKNNGNKDPGQRAECGCVFSKDIGQYNTCPHGCVYCYANFSDEAARKNAQAARVTGESITGDQRV